jgi:hypothetical protein
MLKKGLIFSIDAMFAIVVAGMMVLACFFYFSQTTTNIHNDQDMYKISSDSLTILEKDGTLATAAATGIPTTIYSFQKQTNNFKLTVIFSIRWTSVRATTDQRNEFSNRVKITVN